MTASDTDPLVPQPGGGPEKTVPPGIGLCPCCRQPSVC